MSPLNLRRGAAVLLSSAVALAMAAIPTAALANARVDHRSAFEPDKKPGHAGWTNFTLAPQAERKLRAEGVALFDFVWRDNFNAGAEAKKTLRLDVEDATLQDSGRELRGRISYKKGGFAFFRAKSGRKALISNLTMDLNRSQLSADVNSDRQGKAKRVALANLRRDGSNDRRWDLDDHDRGRGRYDQGGRGDRDRWDRGDRRDRDDRGDRWGRDNQHDRLQRAQLRDFEIQHRVELTEQGANEFNRELGSRLFHRDDVLFNANTKLKIDERDRRGAGYDRWSRDNRSDRRDRTASDRRDDDDGFGFGRYDDDDDFGPYDDDDDGYGYGRGRGDYGRDHGRGRDDYGRGYGRDRADYGRGWDRYYPGGGWDRGRDGYGYGRDRGDYGRGWDRGRDGYGYGSPYAIGFSAPRSHL